MLPLDATDVRLLDLLQEDASLSNQTLAERAHLSPTTCLRRVKRLIDAGVIERQVAALAPAALAPLLIAIVEITLDRQAAEHLEDFEARMGPEPAIQQCYRVSTGPDFVLIVAVRDMDAYHALVHRLFTAQANVRNVRTFFSIKRSKFGTRLPLPPAAT